MPDVAPAGRKALAFDAPTSRRPTTAEQNGHVEHEKEGKAYRYYPTVSWNEAGKNAIGYVSRRLFDGNRRSLLTTFSEDPSLSEEEAEALKSLADDD